MEKFPKGWEKLNETERYKDLDVGGIKMDVREGESGDRAPLIVFTIFHQCRLL
jgi:hypothetical protein